MRSLCLRCFLGVEHEEETNKQSQLNELARSGCEALACLAGFRDGTPDNDGVQKSLKAMLTPYICRLMQQTEDNDRVKIFQEFIDAFEEKIL